MKHVNRFYEDNLIDKGYNYIGGVDEVGRGPLAGPVVASCVVLPNGYYHPELKDSKKLSIKKRLELYKIIKDNAISVETVFIDNNIIDEINILEATKLAMKKAIEKSKLDYVLIDAVKLDINVPSKSIIKGDNLSISISAASIIAKVERDNYMKELADIYPVYGFDTNAGYGTNKHIEAIRKFGITKYHRKSFKPVSEVIKGELNESKK